jgi:aspartate kinase
MSPPQTVNVPEMARSVLKNPDSRGWVVQKFGGTSVGKFPDKIAEDIVRYDFASPGHGGTRPADPGV